MRCKITIVGSGAIGRAAALLLASRGGHDVTVLDEDRDAAEAVAAEAAGAGAGLGAGPGRVRAASGWDGTSGAAIVVLAPPSGAAGTWADGLSRRAPDAVVITADDVSAGCQLVLERTGFPRQRVLGSSRVLDALRWRAALAAATGVALDDVRALVLGGAREAAVPVLASAVAGGVPLRDLLGEDRVAGLAREAVSTGDGELPGTAAAAVALLVDAVAGDRRAVLPCVMRVQGELGLPAAVTGVPAIVGREGVERVVPAPLSAEERAALAAVAGGG